MNEGGVLISQIRALRAQLLATVALLDMLIQDAPPPGCPHPRTENIGTMGHPALRCTVCSEVLKPVPHAEPPLEAAP